ncbi:cell cycle regulated microtubule associated protein-domain-containing protein [Haematococcus lacustris]
MPPKTPLKQHQPLQHWSLRPFKVTRLWLYLEVKTASHAKMLKAALSSARSARNLRTAEHAAAAAAVGARKDTQLLKLRACAGVSSSMPALKSNGIKKPTKRPMKVAQASVAIRRITGRKAARSGLTATPTPAATTAASRKAHQIALAGRSIAARKSERLKRVLAPKKVLPSYSTKPLTMPEEPHLRVNKRLRSGCAKDAGASTQTAHASTPYKPLAAKVKEFESKTPARFKSRALPVELTKPLTRTEPVEPQLHTTMRARPPRFKPTTQLEVEEMEAMPKFHAQPLNHELLACRPSQPVPEPRQPIQQQPFHFVTDLRHERRGRMQEEADTAAAAAEQFRAKPLRKSILEAPTYVPKKSRMSLTIPKSPLLLTKTRSHKVEVEEPKQEFKARPVPSFLQVPKEFMGPSQPELTQPQPFPLCTELRGRLHQERLQAKLLEAEVEAAEARRIKAQLLPLTTDVPLLPPRPEPKPLTVPQPFTLRSEARHEGYIAELSAHLAEEEQHKKQEAEFKARPVWHGIPFQPQPCDLALTVPQEVHLATEVRAVVRQDFDQFMEEKMRAAAEEKAAAEHAARLAEEAATREYRRSLRFKAAPVPAFPAPSPVAPSDKPLTKAKTPKLGRKRKQDEGL